MSQKIAAVSNIVERMAEMNPAQISAALQAILDGASPDDAAILRNMLAGTAAGNPSTSKNADNELASDWREGGYPYKNLLSRKGV